MHINHHCWGFHSFLFLTPLTAGECDAPTDVINVTSVIASMSLSQCGGGVLTDCKQNIPAIPEVMELSLAESDLPVTPTPAGGQRWHISPQTQAAGVREVVR